MPMTAVEKVLAARSGRSELRAGEVVEPQPDFIMIHDGVVLAAKRELDALGIDRLATPERVMIVTDHEVIYPTARSAERGAINRRAAKQWGVGSFYDVGQAGHGHIFPMESGLLLPGMFYFDNDRHSTNAGAIGAFGFRMGSEISRVLATGTNWVMVPKTIRLTLTGRARPGVFGRDIGFVIAKHFREGGSWGVNPDYRVLEFAGDLDQFDLAQRTALCSSPTEVRAYGTFFPPSAAILDHANRVAQRPFTPVYPDEAAGYEAKLSLDISGIEPQVALPGGVYRAVDVSEVAGTRVDHAFIGSCGSGHYEDLQLAARALAGKRIAPGVRLMITPGSERSTRRMLDDGLMKIFIEAGAVMLPAGCGACNDGVIGPVDSGEVSISTFAGNNNGRLGPKDAQLFLGNPATVAASAVAGRIIDPRTVIEFAS
jgi:3-isopropylmalate/(R)-2-methylmalate dehydratase large subunit